MARWSVGIGMAVLGTVLSTSWWGVAPAHAGVEDLLGRAADGPAVVDPVEQELDRTVRDVVDSANGVVDDTVRHLTGQGDSNDTAEEPTPAAGSPRTASPAPESGPRTRSAPAREQPAAGKHARPASDATAPQVPACRSGSLATRDLRRCARAGTDRAGRVPADLEVAGRTARRPLPALGGVPALLLPAGLGMVGTGLLLVARGRRRGTAAVPAS